METEVLTKEETGKRIAEMIRDSRPPDKTVANYLLLSCLIGLTFGLWQKDVAAGAFVAILSMTVLSKTWRKP